MARLLSSMDKYEHFHTPGRPYLKLDIQSDLDGIARLLTDAQLLVLTMNEICVLRGEGQFLWFPAYGYSVTILFYNDNDPPN